MAEHVEKDIPGRLADIRDSIDTESVSYSEVAELQGYGAAGLIPEGDVVLREWAGLPEHEYECTCTCDECVDAKCAFWLTGGKCEHDD